MKARGKDISLINDIVENKKIKIKNGDMFDTIPCNVKFIFSAVLCKCGFYPLTECTCSQKYKGILKNGINDSFINNSDIFVSVYVPNVFDMTEDEFNDDCLLQKKVDSARKMQLKRFGDGQKLNADMTDREIIKYCKNRDSDAYLKEKITGFNCRADEYFKILKVARTIADIDESEEIHNVHIDEALKFSWRNLV